MNDRITQPGQPELSPKTPARRKRAGRSDGFNESEACAILRESIAPVRCCGGRWHSYKDGAWREVARNDFGKDALMTMDETVRTARRASGILDHLELLTQFPINEMRGFYRFDGSAILLNCPNGVLRVEGPTATLEPHSPTHGFTLTCEASYDPDARCPLFQSVLSKSLPDPEDQKLFNRFAGTILLPDCRFETSLVPYGVAGSGKSTLGEALATTIGESLVSRISMRQLTDQKGFHLPKLRFAALNLGTELESIGESDGGIFKAIVSGERVQVRPIYRDSDVMQSTAKLMFLANTLPRFSDGTDAETRRLKIIRFDQKPTTPDVTLKQRLTAERSGILNWMLSGLIAVLQEGKLPEGSKASHSALDRFDVGNDPIGAFVKYACELCPSCQTDKGFLMKAYEAFLAEHGLAEGLKNVFFRKLLDRFPSLSPSRIRTEGGRANVMMGIRILIPPAILPTRPAPDSPTSQAA